MKDEKDRKIIEMLKHNARRPNVEIAQQVGLTEGAVRARIARLVKEGTIKRFTIELGTLDGLFAVVMVKAKSSTKNAMREMVALKTAKELYETSGEFDGCAIVEGDTLQQIDQKIDAIRRCRDVADTRTFIAVRKWV